MRLSAGSLLALLICAGAICPHESAPASPGSERGQIGSKVVYAIHDKQWRKESEISGDHAEVLSGGDVEVTNLQLLLYGYPGKGDMRITAAKCLYRIDKGVIESESDVRIEGSNVVIGGTGLRWHQKDRLVRILDRVRVEIKGVRGWTRNEQKLKT